MLQRKQMQHVPSFESQQEGEKKEEGQGAPSFIPEFLTQNRMK